MGLRAVTLRVEDWVLNTIDNEAQKQLRDRSNMIRCVLTDFAKRITDSEKASHAS